MSTNSWDELSPEQKLTVLHWQKEGLVRQLSAPIGQHTCSAMIRDMRDIETFDPTKIYDRIHPKAKAHWDHVQPCIAVIDEEICKIKREMAEEDSLKTLVKAEPKKKKNKKKKKTPEYPKPKGGCGNGGK